MYIKRRKFNARYLATLTRLYSQDASSRHERIAFWQWFLTSVDQRTPLKLAVSTVRNFVSQLILD